MDPLPDTVPDVSSKAMIGTVNYGRFQSITTWSGSVAWIMSFRGAIEAIGLVAPARAFRTTTSVDRESQEPSIEFAKRGAGL